LGPEALGGTSKMQCERCKTKDYECDSIHRITMIGGVIANMCNRCCRDWQVCCLNSKEYGEFQHSSFELQRQVALACSGHNDHKSVHDVFTRREAAIRALTELSFKFLDGAPTKVADDNNEI